jgi:hypothetical protein
MIRRPVWFATGAVAGVAAPCWAGLSVRRRVRRAAVVLSPAAAGSAMLGSARRAGGRVQVAADAARRERARREAELRSRFGPPGPVREVMDPAVAPVVRLAPAGRRRERR